MSPAIPAANHDLSPSFSLSINGEEIDEGLGAIIESFEYDSSDGGADMMKILLNNPNNVLTGHKITQPGNTIKLWGGFGILEFIGGAIIEKVRPTFPDGGKMATVEVVAYTADRLMMRNSPKPLSDFQEFETPEQEVKRKDKERKAKARRRRVGKPDKPKPRDGKSWGEGVLYSQAVKDKADTYGFLHDIDETPQTFGAAGAFQKQGMTDYNFVAGVANELGWLFWVDADEDTNDWTLHLKDPNKASSIQDEKINLVYASGDLGTLLSFEGEQMMGDGPTDLQIQIVNPKNGQLQTFSIKAEASPGTVIAGNNDELNPDDFGETFYESSAQVTISFGGIAVKTITDRVFNHPNQIKLWGEAWFKANHQNYYMGKGSTTGPGTEKMKARQVHSLEGLGDPWDGDYYMTNVNQKWTSSDGHTTTFSGRKITNQELVL